MGGADPRYLIVHGWAGNESTHWQTWLVGRLRERGLSVQYPELPNYDEPHLNEWLATLDRELARLHVEPDAEKVVLCHSLGAITWMHHAARAEAKAVDRVLLVAPPGPDCGIEEVASFFPVQLDRNGIGRASGETLLVYADDDPYCAGGARSVFGDALAIRSICVPGGGHLNVAAGYGEWPEVETWALTGEFSG